MKVLILGCGWVGEELAKYYVSQNWEVYATCTSEEKQAHLTSLGLQAAVVNFDKEFSISSFPNTFDFVLNSIPASSRNALDEISNRFQEVRSYLDGIDFKKHIFLNSIGIYPDHDGVFEEDFAVDLNERLFVAEKKMISDRTCIYRLGGLFGKNRIFAKYFANRVCTTGDQPANFVHLDDVVALIVKGFKTDLKHSIYNIVAPEHPPKREVIFASAKKYDFDEPSVFSPENSFQKIVDGSKIVTELDYSFKYPSPLNF